MKHQNQKRQEFLPFNLDRDPNPEFSLGRRETFLKMRDGGSLAGVANLCALFY
jgi:hypothetical protein